MLHDLWIILSEDCSVSVYSNIITSMSKCPRVDSCFADLTISRIAWQTVANRNNTTAAGHIMIEEKKVFSS